MRRMQRNRSKITKSVVDSLQKDRTVWDTEIRGFGIRRQVWDKVFILKTSTGGKRRFVTIGRYGSPWTVEQARKEALRTLGSLQSGTSISPDQQALAGQMTVQSLCRKYLQEHADRHKKRSSANSDRRNIENHLIPLLGMKRVLEVSRKDIEQLRDAIERGDTACTDPKTQQRKNRGGKVVTGGRGVANRCLTLVSKMFNLAEDWELRPAGSNPARRVRRFKEVARQRYLQPEELRRLGQAFRELQQSGKVDPIAAAALRLLLYTGARRGEIQSLRWASVDFEYNRLSLSDSKTGPKVVHLSKAAAGVLRSLTRIDGSEFVFPGRNLNKPIVNLQKPWSRLCANARIEGVRIHDLRHTYASTGVGQNFSLFTVGALLSHASPETTARYAHLRSDHVAAANESISSALDELLDGYCTGSPYSTNSSR